VNGRTKTLISFHFVKIGPLESLKEINGLAKRDSQGFAIY
jgi:hypothetical protein